MPTNIIFILLILCAISVNAATEWQELDQGIIYSQKPINSRGALHAFKIDLAQTSLHLALADEQGSDIEDLVTEHHALLGINGGFFSPEYQVLGLRVQDGQVLNPIHPTSWWGIFYTINGEGTIVLPSSYRHTDSVDFAIQAGPRLIINGQIPQLRPGIAERSALCLPRNTNEVIIIATEQAPISTTQLAELILPAESSDGLGCHNALNLDGGRSSQLYANIDDFKLHLTRPSMVRSITDGVLVLPQ